MKTKLAHLTNNELAKSLKELTFNDLLELSDNEIDFINSIKSDFISNMIDDVGFTDCNDSIFYKELFNCR